MAAPKPNVLSLREVQNRYTVFETDQVLTSDQLNGVTEYLNDQSRLTRVHLLGVGIVGGLQARFLMPDAVQILKGMGVTTDGDLLLVPADLTFTRYREYQATRPSYPRLPLGDPAKVLLELVPDTDQGESKPLSGLADLSKLAVVLLMESRLDDPDLCGDGDCDNLGMTATDTPLFLLMATADAAAMGAGLPVMADVARKLPTVAVPRVDLSGRVASTAELARRFRDACKPLNAALRGAFGALGANLPALIAEVFGDDPTSGWSGPLKALDTRFDDEIVGIPYYHDHLRDLAETWEALRDTLLDDDCAFYPDVAAFPKHLVLGPLALNGPATPRTGHYPSPLVDGRRAERDRARRLLRKLDMMVMAFEIPAAGNARIAVTPSASAASPLEERAIPYYYKIFFGDGIHLHWNPRLSRRGEPQRNLGYRAGEYGGDDVARNPLAFRYDRHDFFRVEGHLGKKVETAQGEITRLIQSRGLPFLVRSVLIHDDRKRLVIKPPIRYGDLHRIHYLLRKEVEFQLAESDEFNGKFNGQVQAAVAGNVFPDPRGDIANTATARSREVSDAIKAILPAMRPARYTAYRETANWKPSYQAAVTASGNFKASLGEVIRTDVSTPFDGLAVNFHPAWIDWLDTLIKADEDRENDRLLFDAFLAEHRAFEHIGGVCRGGTFVLLYDENGLVVADGALPYAWHEEARAEPDEPELKRPDVRPGIPPELILKVKPPIGHLLDRFQDRIDPIITQKVDIQKDYFKFVKDSLGVFQDVVQPRGLAQVGVAGPPAFKDEVLGLRVGDFQAKAQQIQKTRSILATLPEGGQAGDLQSQLKTLDQELSRAIVAAVGQLAASRAGLGAGSDGAAAFASIVAAYGNVGSREARARMNQELSQAAERGPDALKTAVKNLTSSFEG